MYKRTSQNGNEKETDFVICIKKKKQSYRLIIESKYRRTPTRVTLEQGKIVLTRDTLKTKHETTYIPVSLFLLIF